ncbi:hypothetical protein OG920_44525 [Streptomyces europaeiscabiei]|uniref:hypothetical protein n=1 Tax=Streptomyces TaxID=1883 RepID=UPI00117FF50A|nr:MULTISPECIES: hypothetical protein [Streptomyces]MDX3615776.1 hypothetical protein [Streptomyces europaeiscabiei]MDX3636820.1 hypothetical protein [Streptomyces europaeiscabiei]MDX3655045.1 hypothetical protein [Streptomyces europaeiscabiei]
MFNLNSLVMGLAWAGAEVLVPVGGVIDRVIIRRIAGSPELRCRVGEVPNGGPREQDTVDEEMEQC